ncbi:MAG: succinylglutamate desuccinylase/aspartoacylase family protein, partial [Zoogloeaceae bacterium]|nr:succinylglutamate desuccinylase/aspartoacylase family protein [Zoogloeaceae bacterium]
MRRFWILALCLGALFFFPQGRAEDETKAWCEQLGRRLHSVAAESCRAWAFVPGTERSVGKHPLMRIDFPPPVPAREVARITRQSGRSAPRPVRIFLIGGIHGDELTSVSIVFRWMDWIAEPQANKYHWRIAPLANPDGLLARPARRTNGHGVDLNRNFPTPDWSRDALSYWSKRTDRDPRRYPGTGPMSEPETRWLTQEIRDFRPDVIVSVHAPYGILDYDGPMQKPRRFGHLNLSQLGVYP